MNKEDVKALTEIEITGDLLEELRSQNSDMLAVKGGMIEMTRQLREAALNFWNTIRDSFPELSDWELRLIPKGDRLFIRTTYRKTKRSDKPDVSMEEPKP